MTYVSWPRVLAALLLLVLSPIDISVDSPLHAADCNVNNSDDADEIRAGTVEDCNENGVPDECEFVPLSFALGGASFEVAPSPKRVVIADLDGDGFNDMVIGSQAQNRSGTLSIVFSGGPPGEFSEAVNLDAGTRLFSVVAEDLDGDGDIDLVAVNSSALLVFKNQGDGQFDPPVELVVPALTRFGIAADLSGDGLPELVVSNVNDDHVAVLLNQGDGVFAEPSLVPLTRRGQQPLFVAAADLDGDGHVDLVTANTGSRTFSVLINEGVSGEAVFREPAHYSIFGPGLNTIAPTDLIVQDLDGDGDPDIVTPTAEDLQVWANPGDGTFPVSESYGVPSAGLAAGDLNDDGHVDLAVGRNDFTSISLLVNRGDGSFRPPQLVALEYRQLAVADLDGDGDVDLAATTLDPDRVNVLFNGEAGGLNLEPGTYLTGGKPHGITMADVNGDGFLDVVTSSGDASTYTLLINRGDGSFELPATTGVTENQELVHLNDVTHADIDNDGDPDLLLTGPRGKLVVVVNLGEGTFDGPVFYPTGSPSRQLTTADVNGDGWVDAVVSNPSGNNVSLFLNAGDGLFEAARNIDVGGLNNWGVTTGDLDNDGKLDIVTGNNFSGDLSILFQDGDGNFGPAQLIALGGNPRFVVVADLDGDGNQDLAASNSLTREVNIVLNRGGRVFELRDPVDLLGRQPYSVNAADLNDDGFMDVFATNEASSSLAVLLGNGDGSFSNPSFFNFTGDGTRFTIPGDLDNDGDLDLATANRENNNVTVFLNNTQSGTSTASFLETICTELDFEGLSIPVRSSPEILRVGKYTAPARDEPDLLRTVFQNVNRFQLHQEFLAAAFPDRFPSLTQEQYEDLVNRRATRDYYVGTISKLTTADGVVYGFNVAVDRSDAEELLGQDEVRQLYDTLRESFTLNLAYFPDSNAERDAAKSWVNPEFPILLETGPRLTYIAYTRGTTFGRVRLFDRASFAEANDSGLFGFQDIAVIDHTPTDIEGVVGGVITAEKQSELSHVFIRTARRNTPNAFLENALEELAPHEGQLVRLRVKSSGLELRPAELEEAQEFWENNQPRLSTEPTLDASFDELLSLDEIAARDLAGEEGLVSRFGGKGTNLARLRAVLDTPETRQYQEKGFVVPMHYYVEFMKSNSMPSALDPSRDVTYEVYLKELFTNAEFQSNSELRFEALDDLRDHMRDDGVVDPALIQKVITRMAEVFATPTTLRVRFRSSSNVEDDIVFNGAGLYDSTSGCAADDLDGDEAGPSHCDSTRDEERTVARALKRVWRSLWNFRAFEERSFFGIDQEITAMGVLVNRTFIDEASNGVAFTGNPTNPLDRRYTITVQKGEESVVSPTPGVRAEKDVLTVVDGEVAEILRAETSSLVPPGDVVVTNDELDELGELMAFIDQNFPLMLGPFSREEVLLDFEFKFMPDGELAVKQVRPFLLTSPPPPAPVFELEIPPNTLVCGVFDEFRTPGDEYALKSTLRFKSGVFELPTRSDAFGEDLIEEVIFGPDRERLLPASEGRFRVERLPAGGDVTRYVFTFEQTFLLGDGRSFDLRGSSLTFRARDEEPLDEALILDEAFFTRAVGSEAFQVTIEGVSAVHYGSCSYDSQPLFRVTAELEDGSSLEFIERAREEGRFLGAQPASVLSAEALLRSTDRQSVRDYFQLVYSAANHNKSVDYWIVLDAPLALPDLNQAVSAVELLSPEPDVTPPRVAQASYLDENFELIAAVPVLSYERVAITDLPQAFRRGDADVDGGVQIADALFLLEFLFRRGATPACRKSADANDDGRLNLADGLALLLHVFRGAELPAPSGSCGSDPTADGLTCESYPACD